MGIQLVIVDGHDAGRAFPVAGATAIGRDAGAGIVLDDEQVSRRHALITAGVDAARVDDLGSTNGTWVNGRRIAAPVELADGDELRLGATTLRLLIAATAVIGFASAEASA